MYVFFFFLELYCGGDGKTEIFLVAHLYSGEIYWWGRVPYKIRTLCVPEHISFNSTIRVKTIVCSSSHCAILSEDGKVSICLQFFSKNIHSDHRPIETNKSLHLDLRAVHSHIYVYFGNLSPGTRVFKFSSSLILCTSIFMHN